ncbi:hypothetical protein SEA_CASSEROLE_45 [Arthrobacter phage Casserole]|nr:hypothetical protein SEA_CASSEROLE_45 [Arthrobacter phage Casserole]
MSDAIPITRKQWEDALSTYVLVLMWEPKKGSKRKNPIVKTVGDFSSYSKANTAKKKMEREARVEHEPERRTIYIARKFDISKLDINKTYYWSEPKKNDHKEDGE